MLLLFVQCMDTLSTQYPDRFIRAAVIESARTSWHCHDAEPVLSTGHRVVSPCLQCDLGVPLHPSAAGICQLGPPLLDGS